MTINEPADLLKLVDGRKDVICQMEGDELIDVIKVLVSLTSNYSILYYIGRMTYRRPELMDIDEYRHNYKLLRQLVESNTELFDELTLKAKAPE